MNKSNHHKEIIISSTSLRSSAQWHSKHNMRTRYKILKSFKMVLALRKVFEHNNRINEELSIPHRSRDLIFKGLFSDNANLIKRQAGVYIRRWWKIIHLILSIGISSILMWATEKIKIQKAEQLATRMVGKTTMLRWFLASIWMTSQSLTKCLFWPWVKAIFGPSLA